MTLATKVTGPTRVTEDGGLPEMHPESPPFYHQPTISSRLVQGQYMMTNATVDPTDAYGTAFTISANQTPLLSASSQYGSDAEKPLLTETHIPVVGLPI